MTSTPDQVFNVEQFLTDLVTQTPIQIRFTASDIAAYYALPDASEVSQWLQRYRDVQGDLTMCTAEFVIATFNRGARSEWFILRWPNMNKVQREMAAVITVEHEIMSLVKEDIAPMLRNLRVQFLPAALANRATLRPFTQTQLTKLRGYRSMLLDYQRDLVYLRPSAVRRQATALNGVLTTTISEIDLLQMELAAV